MRAIIALPLLICTSLVGLQACGDAADPVTSSPPLTSRSSPSVAAPALVGVAKMSGSLHVTWEADDACETVHAERKADMDGMEKYAHAFAVKAAAGNKMDSEATHDARYTYRLRCETDGKFSDYSSELSANPKK